ARLSGIFPGRSGSARATHVAESLSRLNSPARASRSPRLPTFPPRSRKARLRATVQDLSGRSGSTGGDPRPGKSLSTRGEEVATHGRGKSYANTRERSRIAARRARLPGRRRREE